MQPPSAVHHLAVQVRDLESAARFYTEVLGLAVLRRWPGEGQDRSVWIAAGESFLALERVTEEPEARPFRDARPGLHLLALTIPRAERAAWEARLKAAQVSIEHRTDYTLYFRDPEGNRVALSHYPEPASNQNGTR
jgi:catechol-2,3-dioxygenase